MKAQVHVNAKLSRCGRSKLIFQLKWTVLQSEGIRLVCPPRRHHVDEQSEGGLTYAISIGRSYVGGPPSTRSPEIQCPLHSFLKWLQAGMILTRVSWSLAYASRKDHASLSGFLIRVFRYQVWGDSHRYIKRGSIRKECISSINLLLSFLNMSFIYN